MIWNLLGAAKTRPTAEDMPRINGYKLRIRVAPEEDAEVVLVELPAPLAEEEIRKVSDRLREIATKRPWIAKQGYWIAYWTAGPQRRGVSVTVPLPLTSEQSDHVSRELSELAEVVGKMLRHTSETVH